MIRKTGRPLMSWGGIVSVATRTIKRTTTDIPSPFNTWRSTPSTMTWMCVRRAPLPRIARIKSASMLGTWQAEGPRNNVRGPGGWLKTVDYELGEAIGVAPGVAMVSGIGLQEAGASVIPAIGVPAMPLSIRTIEPEPSFAPIAGIET